MEEKKGLVALEGQDPAKMAEKWRQTTEVASELIKTGFLPKNITRPEQVVAIITMGRELNIPMMEALRGIHVIDQKPALAPQLMLAIINRSGFLDDLKIDQQNTTCKVTMTRKGRTPYTVSFGEVEAQRMGLMYKDNYKKQAPNMFKWRAISACARVVFPDIIGGLYLPDEVQSQTDTEGAVAQIEESEKIAGSEGGYDQWLDKFYDQLDHDLELMELPYDIKKWEASHKQELGMLMDNDRQKVDGMLTAKFAELVKGHKESIPKDASLEDLKGLANQSKTVDELINWFKSIQGSAEKQLGTDDFLKLVDECKAIKARLEGEKEPPKLKLTPEAQKLLNYLGGAATWDEFNLRLGDVKNGKAFKALAQKERERFEIGVADIMATLPPKKE